MYLFTFYLITFLRFLLFTSYLFTSFHRLPVTPVPTKQRESAHLEDSRSALPLTFFVTYQHHTLPYAASKMTLYLSTIHGFAFAITTFLLVYLLPVYIVPITFLLYLFTCLPVYLFTFLLFTFYVTQFTFF